MKNFKVQVDKQKVAFFKELLDSLDFVSYEEMEVYSEPRVYPAADFEISSIKGQGTSSFNRSKENKIATNDSLAGADQEKEKMDALKNIRNAINQINKMRDRSS
jgi:hypothetical protein